VIALRTSDWLICDNLNHTAGRENNPAPYQHERLREYFVALVSPSASCPIGLPPT
jgi:hypothetical protein